MLIRLKGCLRTATALALLLTACSPAATPSPPPTSSPSITHAHSDSSSTPPSTTASPNSWRTIETPGWTIFESDRYRFSIGHPSDWIVVPADHDWTLAGDADQSQTTGQDVFRAPNGGIEVGAWAVSLNLDGPTLQTGEDVEACCVQYCLQTNNPSCQPTMRQWGEVVEWVMRFCQQSNAPSCTGVVDQAVPLCIERWDCHPGLIVPFENYVQAFVTGGVIGAHMVVVTVWRGESDAAVAPYGGSRQLLEAFLATMDVCPARLNQTPWGCGNPSP